MIKREWPQSNESWKLSQAASLQDKKEIIPHTCQKIKQKRIDRANIVLTDLKVGTAERKFVYPSDI